MNWLSSGIAAALAAVLGLLLAGAIANACVSWYHVSSREGASGFFVMFLGLAGGVLGCIIGLVSARIVASHFGPGFGKELLGALTVVLSIASVCAILCRLLADVPPTIDGRELTLDVEFRFPNTSPTNQPPTATGDWQFVFASLTGHAPRKREIGTILTDAARFENGQWIVPTHVELFTERGARSVSIAPKDARESTGFLLPLPRRPGPEYLEWSPWTPRQQANGQPWPPDRLSCRFRVQKVPLPPPPKSHEEFQNEETVRQQSELDSIPADAPLERWFVYTAYEQPLTQAALKKIANRPNLVAELNALVVGDNPEQAHAALSCIGRMPNPPKELIPVLQAAATEIANRIQKFNSTPKANDPDFATAVDPATRFYGWIPAAKSLRERCSADLTPELKSILELSRVRPESHCMRIDICRLASFHLHLWAGVAPLPTDPKFD